jgi:SNF2 family DNA or RNA helicase
MTELKQTWSHQIPAIEFLDKTRYSLLAAVMGSGKSYMTVSHLRKISTVGCKRTIILCPSAVLNVWRREFWKHADGEFDVIVLDKGSSKDKALIVATEINLQRSHQRPLVFVVTYESFWRPELLKVFSSYTWEKIVADESHRLKSASSACSKHAWKLGSRAGSRTGLSGSPAPNNPGDYFGQARFLNDQIFGKYWGAFKNEYAIMNQYIPQKVDKWVNLDRMNAKISTFRYYIGPEVLVLPDKQDIVIEVELSAKGRKFYNEMRKESMVDIKRSIENASGETTEEIRTAVGSNGAVQFLRLLQLSQGFIKDTEGEELDTDTEKRKALLDLLEDIDEPVCVYGWFKNDLAIVKRCCDILGRRYGEISGNRKDLTEHATYPEDIDIMGVQCKSGSSGIDLTRARIGITLNSGLLSPGDYDQMMARQYRPGQTRDVIYYHLVAKKTVEEKLIKARQEKRDIVDALLMDLFDEDVF